MKRLVIFVVILGIASVIATITAGIMLSEGTVAGDPYTAALRWDDSHHEQERSGWRVRLMRNELRQPSDDLHVEMLDRFGHPLSGAIVRAHLTTPSTDRYDAVLEMQETPRGAYHARVSLPVRGRWLAVLSIDREGIRADFNISFEVL